jgi:hypothetical protein
MSTLEQIKAAVADKRVSYKDLVVTMYANTANAKRMAEIFADVVLREDDPKVLRKKFRDEQVEQHGDDKATIKEAMVAYDKDHKTKRVPPPPRVWTDEDKAKIKAKNAYVKAKEREQGDDVTVAELKTLRKEWRKEFGELSDDEGAFLGFEEAGSGDDAPEAPKAPEAPSGLTKEEKKLYKELQAKKATQTEEEKKLYKALKAKAKA